MSNTDSFTTLDSCVSEEKFKISTEYKSKNYGSRIREIVLHHTAENFKNSLNTLLGKTKREVSAHYLT